jgi:general secretion pathway protein M
MGVLDNMSTRERNLVTGLGVIFGLILLIGAPVRLQIYLSDKQRANEETRERIDKVAAARYQLAAKKAALGDVAARYSNKAPALGTLVDSAAKQAGLEIATQTDVPPVPRGKLYSERATKLSIQKAGLRALTTFLEKIETSGYPVAITAFDLARRIEPDSYTVNLTLSAFDRTETPAAQPGGPK